MNPLDEIVLSPAPVLTEECAPVEKIDDEIRALAKRMLRDMYAADGLLPRRWALPSRSW